MQVATRPPAPSTPPLPPRTPVCRRVDQYQAGFSAGLAKAAQEQYTPRHNSLRPGSLHPLRSMGHFPSFALAGAFCRLHGPVRCRPVVVRASSRSSVVTVKREH